ncbi:GyrI-like domain-containing protein [Paenibacillus flagellatus]|uniref:AraC effector-binding domain-containing protein n=1 Tax=Paenibacillus flagellatus TaxID=2211139 RepID=A0A2V5K2I7_9BACL|nr:GyrI-like domain-containing protein [Paenibacillus flagellatus]PYI53398.1 hypothetical protein DLM86_16600 [Paenibacillus flagellatus]
MNWRIEQREAFEVFGIERNFRFDEAGKIPVFWDECRQNGDYEKLFDAAGGARYPDGRGVPLEDGSFVIHAVCGYSDLGDNAYPYLICALKKPDHNTTGFKVVQIPKATWAVFRSEKTDRIGTEIPILFKQANSEWLPSSGYDHANGPNMEMYYTAPDGNYFEELWIPVKRAS